MLRLPDGQIFTVTPVFAGVGFRSHEHSAHHHPYPVGWTTVLHTEERVPVGGEAGGGSVSLGHNRSQSYRQSFSQSREEVTTPTTPSTPVTPMTPMTPSRVASKRYSSSSNASIGSAFGPPARTRTRPFTEPTLDGDVLFISSISNPSSAEFKPAASPTRQLAMMLWVTLYWYFHQAEPPRRSRHRPSHHHGPDWRIRIRRDGILRGRNLIPKLERMGLIACEDSAVGADGDEAADGDGWGHMFASRRMFWQIPGRLFLFSLQPARVPSSSYPVSPVGSRPSSPSRLEARGPPPQSPPQRFDADFPSIPVPPTPTTPGSFAASASGFLHGPGLVSAIPVGPFQSSSHLPTYYPPAPLQYVVTDGVRHPLRPKPPRMGEVFYTRFVPSHGQYLAFRVASCSPQPVAYLGPVGPKPPVVGGGMSSMSDNALLQSWHVIPRIREFWGDYDGQALAARLRDKHAFPVIGLWDGVPFGYFEIYWVKEDMLGRQVGRDSADWDRGLHVMIGEEWARGRVPAWLTGLVHWCVTADIRTMSICLEPRVDNHRMMRHLEALGFTKEKLVTFPHKKAWYMKLKRELWEGPAL
ncbi:hypothetical protein RJ55_02363 [Drechmeria coniospora]|nr:hypothetical protein RJ55_02363 [Drechmeria coniospora]